MEPVIIGYIGIGVLILLLFSGLHIGITMGLIGFAGLAYLVGWEGALGILNTVPYSSWSSFDLSVVPLFILMGEFCFRGNLSKDLFASAYKFLGSLKGGLAMATIGACGAFAAVSGSSVATAATMATVVLPEMKKYRYNDGLATGTLAAGGTLGILIPPSIYLIIYGMLTEQSIGELFLAGIIPGIFQALLFIAVIGFICYRNPSLGPAGPRASWKDKITSLKGVWIVVLLFLLVIGGINLGWFSPTEGAGIGAAGAFLFALARRRMGKTQIKDSLVETIKTSGMIFFILLGAMILGYFFAVTRLPNEISTAVASLNVSPYLIWFIIVLIYLFLGCVMDSMAMILLTVPILYPVMCGPSGLGFDPIWFGIMIVIIIEMGLITPPVGINVFVIKGMAQTVPTTTIFRGILPFVLMMIIEIVILTAIPGIVTWLPDLLR